MLINTKMLKLVIAGTFMVITIQSQSQEIQLATNGKSDYSIYVANPKDSSVTKAANLFNSYFERVSGVNLPYKPNGSKLIRFQLAGKENNRLTCDEGYTIKTTRNNLIFESKTGKGLQNAVYTFLENYLSCRCYAEDAIVIPQKKDITIKPINLTENPSFHFRAAHYYEATNANYNKWHKLSNNPRQEGQKSWPISNDWGLWVHTLHRLVPPEKYFKDHPEYYALRNGQRLTDQLCLTNPDVLRIAIESLRDEISKNPTARYWSVSQMDNYNFCQCEHCREIDSIEGSNAGSMIWFVNQVSKQFPDKVISTLAYQYSRKAPKHIRPEKNVNIMLCTIECDRSRPIESETSEGGFHNDLKNWAALTDNILIWDYVINFSHLVGPFPNWQVLGPNINLFNKYHVGMLFEQGYRGSSGELNELRCYILSKLMWNAKLNVDSLITDFTNGYYGPAGKYVREYIDLQTMELNKSGRALTLYEPPAVHAKGYLSPENLDRYFSILYKAKEAVQGNNVLDHRVEMVLQSVRYAWLEVTKSVPHTDGWVFQKSNEGKYSLTEKAIPMLETFYANAMKYGPSILHETSNPPDEYRSRMLSYYQNAIVDHQAVGKTITFEKPYAPQYSADGPNSLIDGVCGTEAYQMLWQGWQGEDVVATIDLQDQKIIKGVEISFLDDNQSWIIAPTRVKVEVSQDGNVFVERAHYDNPNPGTKIERQIVKFEIPFHHAGLIIGRYIRITVKSIGKVPAWRGVDGNAWTFIDEIIIK